ncbi:MAG: hypothetical protein HZB09_02675 [Candidatus Yonathbacteria bacterium]|nr:hypothetical protein [Candidatus Yonathbacteria bacterium]
MITDQAGVISQLGLAQAFSGVWTGVVMYAPKIITAFIIFVLGWIIGAILGKVIAQIIKALKIERVFENTEVVNTFNRAGFQFSVGGFVGGLVKWFIVVVFLVASFDILGLSQVNEFLRNVVLEFIPNVIVAVFVLVVGALLADAVQRIVTGGAKAARIHSAPFFGSMARWAIWIFAVLIALSQIGIAREFMQTLFLGVVVMFSVAGGLAFGLGGKEAAARFLEKMRHDMGGENR